MRYILYARHGGGCGQAQECLFQQGHRNCDAAPSRPRVATNDGHELRAAPRVRTLCLSLPLYLDALWASLCVMSSLMNWDGSQDAQPQRGAKEARYTPGAASDEDAVEAAMVVDDVSAAYLS